jgi:bacteriocin biosynthesis cyclodehydratase domain-containing protein
VADLVAGAVAGGARRPDALDLLDRLHRAGAVVDAAAEAAREDRRAAGAVLVHGDGPLAVGLAVGLARAGVGAVHVRTGGTVQPADLGTGLVEADLGRRRAEAVTALVGQVQPAVATGPPPARFAADLVVLADALAPDPTLVTRLHGAGSAHLVVRLRDGRGVVGPLVLPGRSACLRCLELHRTARDPTWAGVAVQLVGRAGQADPACTVGAVALGTAQAVAVLDGTEQPPTLQATLELDAAAGVVRHRTWRPHPDCGCGAVDGAAAP